MTSWTSPSKRAAGDCVVAGVVLHPGPPRRESPWQTLHFGAMAAEL